MRIERRLLAMLGVVYASGCAACDRAVDRGAALCTGCEQSLYPLGAACPRCALPAHSEPAPLCPGCRASPPPLAAMHAGYRYGGQLAVALRRLKYGGRADLARQLRALVSDSLATVTEPVDVVVPIPLHRRRLGQRGYNQAERLLHHARAASPAPISPALLIRSRHTAEQAGLSARDRARNLAGAFGVPAAGAPRIADRRVLLFDDVVTTGATLAAAATTLRRAGARAIVGCCLARAEATGPSC